MGEPVYTKIDLNFNGEFLGLSHTYEGNHFMFSDMDFAGLNYQQCMVFLERFTGSPLEKLYYCQRNRPLKTGIRCINDDADYAHFLDEVYEDPDIPMSIYMDHSGDGLNDWFESGSEVEDNAEAEVRADSEPEPGYMFGVGLVDEIAPDDFMVHLQKTREDEFLNKLCPEKGDIVGDEDSGDEENLLPEVGPRFDPDVNWKEQEPVLGMRFEDPKQLKNMLCNYAVRFGYQLCFQKNDRTRLLAVCCKGDCTFRLWATWMSTEQSFQIKSLIGDHNCARNTSVADGVADKVPDPSGNGGGRPIVHESTEGTLTGENLGNTDNINRVLGVMRKKKSERILKKKLAKRVQGVNGEGNNMETPMTLE